MIPFFIKPKLGLVLMMMMVVLILPNWGHVTAAGPGMNVIMMVMDGTSSNAVTLARL